MPGYVSSAEMAMLNSVLDEFAWSGELAPALTMTFSRRKS